MNLSPFPAIVAVIWLVRFLDPAVAIGTPRASWMQLLRWRAVVAAGVGLGLNIGARTLRELVFRSEVVIGAVVRVNDANGSTVNTFYGPWWWSDWVMAVPGIILAVYLYRFLHLRAVR